MELHFVGRGVEQVEDEVAVAGRLGRQHVPLGDDHRRQNVDGQRHRARTAVAGGQARPARVLQPANHDVVFTTDTDMEHGTRLGSLEEGLDGARRRRRTGASASAAAAGRGGGQAATAAAAAAAAAAGGAAAAAGTHRRAAGAHRQQRLGALGPPARAVGRAGAQTRKQRRRTCSNNNNNNQRVDQLRDL